MAVRLARRVVIDKDALGWDDEHGADLKGYAEIISVSKHPSLLQRDSDLAIAKYCAENDCDLITADKEFYMHYFDAGIGRVSSRMIGERGGKYVYLINIVE